MTPPTLSFSALVGLDAARQALLLLAVDPGLGGAVIAAGVGTGKSTLARSFAQLLDQTIFVELPVSITEDRLLGGLDLEATLARGERVHRSGVLARAHGGLLYADSVNLLDDTAVNHLLAALDGGVVRVEREGLSVVEPARFALLATYDPGEGPPRRHLLDRVGLIVAPVAQSSTPARAEVVRRNLAGDHGRLTTNHSEWSSVVGRQSSEFEEEDALLQALVLAAREALPATQISDAQIGQLTQAALALGVEGHRADIFAVRAALAAAALPARDEVADEELERAVRLVLLPRATRAPQSAEQPEQQSQPAPPPPEPQPPADEPQRDDDDDEQEEQPPPPPEELTVEELILAALDTDVPPDVLETPFTVRRSGRSGSRGSTSGTRGRHIRSVPGLPSQGRLDVIATLRAAAPWQRVRRDEDRRMKDGASGSPPHPSSLIPHPSVVYLKAEDLHIKKYRSKAGTLFCFVVDASGSMALHRMRQAKGAVNALLQQAYVHRDQVALLAFRGEQAELLLPPSQSVELAKRALDVLPTGGGTPLAAALLAAYQVSEQARSRGIPRTTLVLITDGRPNVPLRPDPAHDKQTRLETARQEVQTLSAKLRAAGVGAVVIDTQRSYVSRGEAQQLAAWLGGRYVYLPQGRGEQIAQAVLAASTAE